MLNLTLLSLELMNLTAAMNGNSTVLEARTMDFPFSIGAVPANFTTLEHWKPFVEILTPPSQGSLYQSERLSQALVAGVLIPLEEIAIGTNTTSLQANVVYDAGNQVSFTLPFTTADQEPLGTEIDSFEFRIVALNTTTLQVLTSTAPVVQPIPVLNVNDPPTLTAPLRANATDKVTFFGGRRSFVVDGIHLDDDKDRNVDKVRVDVWATNGTLTLNQDVLHLAEFSSCSIRSYTDWKCRGRGDKDGNMTFLATPDHVNLLLAGMTYQPHFRNIRDTITVRVHDGMGGDCLDREEHLRYGNDVLSQHHGCYTVQATILVPTPAEAGVQDDDDADNALGVPEIFGVPIAAILFWALAGAILYGIVFCLYRCVTEFCCCCCRPHNNNNNNNNNKARRRSPEALDIV